jgi:acyl carrier protein
MERLPVTPNGKVDRRRLPEVERSVGGKGAESEGARTVTEELLGGIWEEVLGVERVGIHDNFFELGGHSLLATQVASRVQETMQVKLALKTLFAKPTVAGLAEAIEATRNSSPEGEGNAAIMPISRESFRRKLSAPAQNPASALSLSRNREDLETGL